MTRASFDPTPDDVLDILETVDVPSWETDGNQVARAFRMADHVAGLVARIRRDESLIADLRHKIEGEWE